MELWSTLLRVCFALLYFIYFCKDLSKIFNVVYALTEVGELEQMGSSGDFSRLTLRHGLKCMPDDSISVEDVLVAVSEQVGGLNIKSASR